MIEYCYDAVRLNLPDVLTAYITDENEELITEDCVLNIYKDDELIALFEGYYDSELGNWNFEIDGKFEEGRYSYNISHNGEYLDFEKPLYIM